MILLQNFFFGGGGGGEDASRPNPINLIIRVLLFAAKRQYLQRSPSTRKRLFDFVSIDYYAKDGGPGEV